MSLILSPSTIGEPDWEQIPVGDLTGALTQYYNLRTKVWIPVGWFAEDGYVCRYENHYRRPVTFRAKIWAIWAARGKLFRRYVLRQDYATQMKGMK